MENRYIHFGIVLGLIAAISAGLLGGVNGFTSKVIAENTLKIVNEARKQVYQQQQVSKKKKQKKQKEFNIFQVSMKLEKLLDMLLQLQNQVMVET